MEVGPGGVPKGAKTSDYYRVKDIPNRFDHPGNKQNTSFIHKGIQLHEQQLFDNFNLI